MVNTIESTSKLQNLARIILGLFMILAGIGHLSIQLQEFQTQVPDWIPLNKDLVVILSGIIEILLGVAMIFWRGQRIRIGIALAIFYVLVFPGNIAQYTEHRDAFGLDTDTKRLIRLFFQPVLILLTLWSTGALKQLIGKSPGINNPQ
ncbi:putative membrane protein [Pedobacter sp. AK017]|uniref:DoxX family protein n=1 Tax=Pedobacter sp. AK017 TaxID=2723073 RepID=UPI00160B82AC|nr:DoxX family membrane protein [Pedobacter sp. AK017]MBB5439013.1 putative membrane protein [Pedobacter sp. AK017]